MKTHNTHRLFGNKAFGAALLSLGLLALLSAAVSAGGTPRQKLNINPVWRFALGDPADAAKADFDDRSWDTVSLPHSHELYAADISNFKGKDEVKEPYVAFAGRKVGWYRRTIDIPATALSGKVFLVFQGAMETTRLWVNGKSAGECLVGGYTSFHFDITPLLQPGKNRLAVRVDNTVQKDIPPDGAMCDFVLFGGLYRDVDLIFTGTPHVTFPWEGPQAGVRLTLPEVSPEKAVVQIETALRNDTDQAVKCTVVTRVLDKSGKAVATVKAEVSLDAKGEAMLTQKTEPIHNPNLWSPDSPYLYTVETTVMNGNRATDQVQTKLGIRWCQWDKEKGFFLNGKHLKLVGANRHQAWPFIGSAVPNKLHRADAEQMKKMGINWVRLSHYPHAPAFLDDLDELGLMALEEGPTWMHTPSETWMKNLDTAFRSMIRRDRNHPSIIIWNCCVNHQGGNDKLVKAATEEDPTRARGQDTVPCPMNFEHLKISGNAALCIEHTGHTFNTFRGQELYREYDLTQRHWEHTDAAYKKVDNSGLAVWAMYDYNTPHYGAPYFQAPHGVCDIFRIPKLSYYWHCAELGKEPITYLYPFKDDKVVIFSNAEKVRFSESIGGKDFKEVGVLEPDKGLALRHPPFHATVSKWTTCYKAEGLVNGKVVSSHIYHRQSEPAALKLSVDHGEITADGGDMTRVHLQLVDKNGTVIVNNYEPVNFAIEGAGLLVGENPTQLMAGQCVILVRSSFEPGKMTITAEMPGMEGIDKASVSLQTVPVAANAQVDMPKTTVKAPTGKSVMPTNLKKIQVNMPADDFGWFVIPALENAEPGQIVESKPMLVAGQRQTSKLAVQGCEYRIYSSAWSSAPTDITRGDALFFRMKSNKEAGQTATAEVTIQGVKRTFTVKTK
jgi:beta-galactosidase